MTVESDEYFQLNLDLFCFCNLFILYHSLIEPQLASILRPSHISPQLLYHDIGRIGDVSACIPGSSIPPWLVPSSLEYFAIILKLTLNSIALTLDSIYIRPSSAHLSRIKQELFCLLRFGFDLLFGDSNDPSGGWVGAIVRAVGLM